MLSHIRPQSIQNKKNRVFIYSSHLTTSFSHSVTTVCRSYSKQVFLKISQCSQEYSTVLESLFNKVADLKAWNSIKKRLQYRYFPVNIVKFLGTAFSWNTSGGCFCTFITLLRQCKVMRKKLCTQLFLRQITLRKSANEWVNFDNKIQFLLSININDERNTDKLAEYVKLNFYFYPNLNTNKLTNELFIKSVNALSVHC